jgi:hypothetical protein
MLRFAEFLAADYDRDIHLTESLIGLIGFVFFLIFSDLAALAASYEAGTFKLIFKANWIDHFLTELESDLSLTHQVKKDIKYARE